MIVVHRHHFVNIDFRFVDSFFGTEICPRCADDDRSEAADGMASAPALPRPVGGAAMRASPLGLAPVG
jgi:hypothetical protein